MDKSILVEFIKALQELHEQVPHQVFTQWLVHLYQSVQLAILSQRHHVVAERVLPLDDATVVR